MISTYLGWFVIGNPSTSSTRLWCHYTHHKLILYRHTSCIVLHASK